MTTKPAPQDLRVILKVNGYVPFETAHLNIVDVISEDLDFIWNSFSDGCPFSFGDNNYTLVDAMTIRNWVVDLYDLYDEKPKTKKQEKAIEKFKELMNLCFDSKVYINVE